MTSAHRTSVYTAANLAAQDLGGLDVVSREVCHEVEDVLGLRLVPRRPQRVALGSSRRTLGSPSRAHAAAEDGCMHTHDGQLSGLRLARGMQGYTKRMLVRRGRKGNSRQLQRAATATITLSYGCLTHELAPEAKGTQGARSCNR
eukprot:scaffold1564_cov389-Prasinococcus_capsulatus_cf.AAC.2